MNRFSNITQATYTPLSLQEIMAVPLAKQAQHDQLQAEMDAEGIYSASVSQSDKERIGSQVDALNKRVSDISTGLGEEGINSNFKSQFRKLKADKARAYGADGDIGFAQADYANQAKYMSDMKTNKDMQAGWSGQQAQDFAAKQISEYGSSFNEDGTRKSGFSGRSLAKKMDEDEFTRAAIDDIEEQISSTSMKIIRTQGLPAFKAIAQTSKTAYKDLNLIMGHLTNATQTNSDMMASLAQQAEFDGEENWDDFGGYEEKILQDENGNDYKQTTWRPGKSRYGRKIAGLGQVSSYARTNLKQTLFDDDAAQALHEAGMDAEKVQSLVSFSNGELNQNANAPLSEIKNSFKLYDDQVKSDKANLDKYVANLKASGLNGEELDAHLNSDRLYIRQVKNYEESQVKADNAKSRIDYIEKAVKKDWMSENDNNAQAIIDEMDEIGVEALYDNTFGKGTAAAYKKKHGMVDEKAKLDILVQKGINLDDITSFTNPILGFNNVRKALKKKSNEGSAEFLASKEFAMSHTIINAESVGKYASPIGRANELLSKSFNPAEAKLAYGGGSLADLDLDDAVGEVEEGYPLQYTVRLTGTGGWDQDGEKFNDVMIKNPKTGKVTSVQIIDNNNEDLLMEGASQMMANGTAKQKKEGLNLAAGLQYMPAIKRSNMFSADTGIINGLKLSGKDGKSLNVEWKKVKTNGITSYRATVGGEQILYNGYEDILTENEMALALYAYVGKKQEIYAKKQAEKQQQ